MTKKKDMKIINRELFNQGIDLLVDGKYCNLPEKMRQKIKDYVKQQDLTKINLGLELQIRVHDDFPLNSILQKTLSERAQAQIKRMYF